MAAAKTKLSIATTMNSKRKSVAPRKPLLDDESIGGGFLKETKSTMKRESKMESNRKVIPAILLQPTAPRASTPEPEGQAYEMIGPTPSSDKKKASSTIDRGSIRARDTSGRNDRSQILRDQISTSSIGAPPESRRKEPGPGSVAAPPASSMRRFRDRTKRVASNVASKMSKANNEPNYWTRLAVLGFIWGLVIPIVVIVLVFALKLNETPKPMEEDFCQVALDLLDD